MDPLTPDSFNHFTAAPLYRENLSLCAHLYCLNSSSQLTLCFKVDQKPDSFHPNRTHSLLCLHGMPDSWYGWRYQIGPWVRNGARVIVPDMLGYGGTDKPKDPAEYTPKKLCDDLVALLDLLEVKNAVVIGHDWGAFTAGRFALWYPHRILALVMMSLPYTPPSPTYIPVQEIAKRAPNLGYQMYLADARSTADIEANLERFVDIVFKPPASGVDFTPQGAFEKFIRSECEVLTPEQERSFYLGHLAKGMEGPLNYTRTYKARYNEEKDLPANLNPDLPVLFIWGTQDLTTTSFLITKSHKFIPRLQDVALESIGHWVMVEAKDEVTEIVASWLKRLTSSFPLGKL
ncbi:epoxide hydrolase [Amanita rubescens]|nr:epoxide hydrolase [Amanita rubescens]